jgi:hypothetical protein
MTTGTNLFEIIRQVTGWSMVPPVEVAPVAVPAPLVTVIDRRGIVRPVELSPVDRVVDGKRIRTSRRDILETRTVLLHQMDCELGIASYQLKAAGGDMLEARIQRAMNLPYHDVILRGNILVRNHPYTVRTAHAGLGNSAVGIGVEGKYPLVASKRTAKHTDLGLVVHAARRAVELAVAELRGPSGRAIGLQAHRQWSASRAPDPGEEIWREVGLYAVERLGLVVDYELGRKGLPIPREWDPSAHYGLKEKVRG